MVNREHVAAAMLEAEIVVIEHAQANTHFGADRIERRVKKFFGDAELGQAHWQNAADAPHKQHERRLHRNDLQRAGLREAAVLLNLPARRINDRLQRRELRIDALRCSDGILVRKFFLIRRIDFRIELDRLHRRPGQPQRLGAIAALARETLDLKTARQRLRIELQNNQPLYRRAVGIDQNYRTTNEARGVGECGHELLAFRMFCCMHTKLIS